MCFWHTKKTFLIKKKKKLFLILLHFFFLPSTISHLTSDDFVIDTVVSSSELLSDVADGNVIAWGELKDIQQEEENSSDIHNAYMAAGILAGALLILAVVVSFSYNHIIREFFNEILLH